MVDDIVKSFLKKRQLQMPNYRVELQMRWLKSFKEKYTWKPSDEQMSALDDVIDVYNGYPEFDSLVSLKNDLKKLKG